MKVSEKTEQEKRTIAFTPWRILGYLILYSVLGFLVETVYGYITKGVLESRQSFLYGPFCGIYGVGAVLLIVCLRPFSKNIYTLFLGGILVGSAVEYLISWIGETLFGIKWWDYSHMPFHLNGRICLRFSVFWGVLGCYLVGFLNPQIERFVRYLRKKGGTVLIKALEIAVAVFLVADMALTFYALKVFYIRVVAEHDLNVKNRALIEQQYESIYGNEKKREIIDRFFSDEKMMKTFPNLKLKDQDGKIIFFETVLYGVDRTVSTGS